MTQDEIIEMARQAGFPFNKYGLLQGDDEGEIDADAMFEAFAKLVEERTAAKEREKDLFLLQTNAEAYASEGKQATANLLFAMANIIRARGEADRGEAT